MRRATRFVTTVLTVGVILATGAVAAPAAQVVKGTIAPSSLKGKPTVVMFFHPF